MDEDEAEESAEPAAKRQKVDPEEAAKDDQKDEEEVEETVIESTETDQDEIIIEEIEVEEEFEDIDVPFAVIEDVPIFPGCESVSKSQRRSCFQDKMNNHIRRNFRYPEIAQEMVFKVEFM